METPLIEGCEMMPIKVAPPVEPPAQEYVIRGFVRLFGHGWTSRIVKGDPKEAIAAAHYRCWTQVHLIKLPTDYPGREVTES